MSVSILRGDARTIPLQNESVDLIITSPPYFGLRSYTDGGEHYGGQIGSEATPQEWVAAMVDCTREMMRVLKPEGSIFINLGDKYAGGDGRNNNGTGSSTLGHHKGGGGPHSAKLSAQGPARGNRVPGQPKSLLGLPWRYALAATDQLGLILRRDIIWAKPNGLPESVTDRCRSSHEYVFHLVRQPRYYSAVDEIREPQDFPNHGQLGKDARGQKWNGIPEGQHVDRPSVRALHPLGKLPGSVWSIPSQPLTVPASVGVDHFAAFPVELPRRIVLGWSPPGVCVACGQGRRPVVTGRDLRPAGHPGRPYSEHDGRVLGAGRHGTGASTLRSVRDVTVAGYTCACPVSNGDGHRWCTLCGRVITVRQQMTETAHGAVHWACLPTRPALVLDPFAGTGTTLLAAAALGRHAIGIDRSADYCRLARWRVNDPGERAKAMEVPKPPQIIDGQESLFAF